MLNIKFKQYFFNSKVIPKSYWLKAGTACNVSLRKLRKLHEWTKEEMAGLKTLKQMKNI